MNEIDRALCAERHQLKEFILLYREPNLDASGLVNHRGDLRDLLARVVAWHESFA